MIIAAVFIIEVGKNPDVQQRNGYRKYGTFTQWSTTQLPKNNEFMKFLGKWMELESVILSEVTHSQKNTHGMHTLWMLAQKLKINKLQFTQHRKLKKKEDLSEGAFVPLRKGTKYSQEQ